MMKEKSYEYSRWISLIICYVIYDKNLNNVLFTPTQMIYGQSVFNEEIYTEASISMCHKQQ